MKVIKNYYVFVFYDVGENRVNKVFKVCKKYLNHFQNSVFRGEITPANIMLLKNEIKKVIDSTEDFVTFVELLNDKSFSEMSLGSNKKIVGDSIIL